MYGLGVIGGPNAVPGSWYCNWMPNWLLSPAEQTSCAVGLAPVAVPPVPTQAQLDAVAAASDPGAAAAALTQQLSNQAVTQTQANTQAAVDASPSNIYLTFPAPAPFCGDGSSQWVSGIDNCTLLEVVGAVVVGLIILGSMKAGRR
jgi:hypothetical protein